MGQKIHPYGFRVGITRPWRSRWYADKKTFGDYLVEDYRVRTYVLKNFKDAQISRVEIERKAGDKLMVLIHTARSGSLLGRNTNRIAEIEREVSEIAGGKTVEIRLIDVQRPELDAQLAAQRIADQIERRFPFRRASARELENVKLAGAKGVKVTMSGRLGGADLARTEKAAWGSVPLHTLKADVDYGFAEANTTYGIIGIKLWIHRGEIGAEPVEQQPRRGAGRREGGPRGGREGGRDGGRGGRR